MAGSASHPFYWFAAISPHSWPAVCAAARFPVGLPNGLSLRFRFYPLVGFCDKNLHAFLFEACRARLPSLVLVFELSVRHWLFALLSTSFNYKYTAKWKMFQVQPFFCTFFEKKFRTRHTKHWFSNNNNKNIYNTLNFSNIHTIYWISNCFVCIATFFF